MEDEAIISLFFQRSEEAIAETGKKYGAFLHRLSYNILRSREDSEEVVDDTYLRAWNEIPPKKPNALRHFLGRIARNLSLDRLDARNAQKRGGGELAAELDECVPDALSDVESAFGARELTRELNAFLAELDEESCAVFVSRYYYAMPTMAIAAKYGLSERRVKYVLKRSRDRLRERLEKEELQ